MTGPRTVAWFHCFSGIAGDMALGSLLDAGADPDQVVDVLDRLSLDGWSLRAEPVLRGGIACTRAVVAIEPGDAERPYRDVVALLTKSELPDRVRDRALTVFAALADAEAAIHRVPVSDVHFHEVGAHDAIIDVVGTAAALELLGIDEVTASAVAVGTGTVRSAHGVLPNPAPAVVRLLTALPTYGRDTGVELTTPTGAAILAGLGQRFGPMPAMTPQATGYGAGSRDPSELPNCVQVVIGATAPASGSPDPGQSVVELVANVDDATGEELAHAIAALMGAGAYDAWITPVVMKKGRPGHTVHALADPSTSPSLRQVFRTTTGTFGVRAFPGERWPVARAMDEVTVEGQPVRIKVGPHRIKAEFDDVAQAAEATGLPVGEVASRAEAAWREAQHGGPCGRA